MKVSSEINVVVRIYFKLQLLSQAPMTFNGTD